MYLLQVSGPSQQGPEISRQTGPLQQTANVQSLQTQSSAAAALLEITSDKASLQVSAPREALHDVDASAQWLELLASAPALPVAAAAAAPNAASTSGNEQDAASSIAEAVLTSPSVGQASGPCIPSQKGSVHSRGTQRDHEPQQQLLAAEAAQKLPSSMRRRSSLRTRTLIRRRQPASHAAASDLDSSSSDSTMSTQDVSRPRSRSRGTRSQDSMLASRLYQPVSSDDSDQMTFAEAAGIRRRPDAAAWPALNALQEGRQVQLLDRHSPIPARSKVKPSKQRDSSHESLRRFKHLLRAADNTEPSARPGHLHAGRHRTPTGDRMARALHPGDMLASSSDDESAHTLERLLLAWQSGVSDSEAAMLTTASRDRVMKAACSDTGRGDAELAGNAKKSCMLADSTAAEPLKQPAQLAAEDSGHLGDELQNHHPSTDSVLAGFWDSWNTGAGQQAGSGKQLDLLQASSLDILTASPGAQQQKGHAPSLRQKHPRRGHQKEHVRWQHSQPQQIHSQPHSKQRHPSSEAAAAGERRADHSQDPLEGLLDMYPGLDPVVADLILQVEPCYLALA